MGKAWKQPTEVEWYQVPGNRSADPDRIAFLQDVLRRLEATGNGSALAYPFTDAKQMQLYQAYLTVQVSQQRGKGTITSRRQIEPLVLYVKRGPNWGN